MSVAESVVRPAALDYLNGLTLDPGRLPADAPALPPAVRRLEHVRAIGASVAERAPAGEREPFPTEALLAGLAGESIPFAFEVEGGPQGVSFRVGTWRDAPGPALEAQGQVMTSLLDAIHADIDRVGLPSPAPLAFPLGGLAHGLPGSAVRDGEAPWDRLLRGLQGAAFGVVILAEPVDPRTLAQLRDVALEDVRAAVSAQGDRGELPIAKAYVERLESLIAGISRALVVGGWRTGVYLLGDAGSYWRLAAAWRGLFSGEDRKLLPLRVFPSPAAPRLAAGWSLPYQPAPAGPRGWQHPFLNQTLLDSTQLASMAHLPQLDVPGLTVRPAPRFPTSRRAPEDPQTAVSVGEILTHRRPTGSSYDVDLDQLTRHVFVAGLTGSGKTNTLMHLLTEVQAADVPFLVIEPAKTEYRELLGRAEMAGRLRVFTLGREQVAPLRMNPFEVPDGIDVATHLDLLKAVFMGSFAMWIPLPQVLEQCMIELYTERGWDLAAGARPAGAGIAPSVPTLGDLVAAVERTVPTLGYKPESTQEITASLTTRLNALRRGTRGLMLDVERSIPMDELLSAPTVIELEGLGDDADKAFVMGLLLVRLYEHRRAEHTRGLSAAAAAGRPAPSVGVLRHVVVIEEAHRLLAATKKPADSFHADPQGAFAETFSHMLAEVRAYGQSIVIADQVPVRLAPDVLKNTNLKIAHRLVADDDRSAMGGAMAMRPEQGEILATLPRGRAAVFSEGDHAPVIVAVRKAKDLGASVAVDDLAVAKAMAAWRATPQVARYFENEFCSGVCRSPGECREARSRGETAPGRLLSARLFNSAIAHPDGLDAVWPDVVAFVSARVPAHEDALAGAHAFAVHAVQFVIARRASQSGWSLSDQEELGRLLRSALAERAGDQARWLGATAARERLLEAAARIMARPRDPYPLCSAVCPDGTCRYRDSVADVLTHPRHALYSSDLPAGGDDKYVLEVAGFAGNDVVAVAPEAPDADGLTAARWRATGCAAQVKFCSDDHAAGAAEAVERALRSAGWALEAPAAPRTDVNDNGGGAAAVITEVSR